MIRIAVNPERNHRGRCIDRAHGAFAEQAARQDRQLRRNNVSYRWAAYVAAAREGTRPLTLVPNDLSRPARKLYGYRLSVAKMVGVFKSCGFDLELTHRQDPDLIEKLVGMSALALTYAFIAACGEPGRTASARPPAVFRRILATKA